MRVAIITPELAPYYVTGGIGQHVNRLAVGLAERGHAVTVAGVGIHDEPAIDHGSWRSLAIAPINARLQSFLDVPGVIAALSVRRYLARCHGAFDVIETINFPGHGGFVDAAGMPYVVRLVTPFSYANPPRSARTPRVRARIATWLERRGARRATRLISSSTYMLSTAESLYRCHVPADIVPFGIPDVRERQAEPTSQRMKFVVVGRAEFRKGTDVLVRALDIALARVDAELVFVGGDVSGFVHAAPELHDAWRRVRGRSGSQITELGQVDDERRDLEIASAHWLLSTSRFESFGLTVPEAMRCGTPAIVSDGGALPEVSASSTANIVYGAADDPAGLAEALIAAVTRGAADALARRSASRAAYVDHFTLDRYVDASVDAYQRAIFSASRAAAN